MSAKIVQLAALVLQNGDKTIKWAGKTWGDQWLCSCLKYTETVINSGSKRPRTKCRCALFPREGGPIGESLGWLSFSWSPFLAGTEMSSLPGCLEMCSSVGVRIFWSGSFKYCQIKINSILVRVSQIVINGFNSFLQRGLWKHQSTVCVHRSVMDLSLVLQ